MLFAIHHRSCAAPLVISEFMAANASGLRDEDNSAEDWIELRNTGASPVNLLNWCLTDDAANLTQWRFPATNLNAGAYLVVFASGKNRRTPGARLHTNFRLASSGEYLALVEPDGVTVASEFTPLFPPQVDDVSFGLDSGYRSQVFLPTNATGRLRVPSSGAEGTNWILPGYSDTGWTGATGGVGFVAAALGELGVTNSLVGYWKFDETSGLVAADSSGQANAGGLRNFPVNNSQWVRGRVGGALNFRGVSDYVFVTNYPKSATVLTVAAWVWADSRPTWASVAKNWAGGNASHFHLGLQDTAGDLSNFIRQNNADYGLREGTIFPLGSWQHVAFVLDATTERLYRNGVQVNSAPYSGSVPVPTVAALAIGAKANNGATVVDSYWHGRIDEVAVWNRALSPAEVERIGSPGGAFGSFIATDTMAGMFRSNATCYLRFPFVVDNPDLYTRWMLRLRYNDGFVAWLNGQEVARRHAPEALAWNSAATIGQPASAGTEVFNLAEFESLFVAGTNVLALQALNVSAADPDFFIAPSLDALSTVAVTNAPVYFPTPTPGSDNVPGVAVPGPIIAGVTHSPAVPADNENVLVTARVAPASAAVTNVTLRYRVMYANEVSVPMFDDGAHGDGGNGDGVFGAMIPASASTNGQMIRYAITAADVLGRTSRAPLFNDPLNADEYFGTIVSNPALTTPLPVFHWFVANPAAAETSTGTRCSLFYNGEFYDNLFIRIRGGTAISWPKKSYKVEMNEDHEFLLRPGMKRVTEFDLNATYTDKAYVRARLTYEHQRDAGLPSPETFHVHLRQNVAFYSVALYVDTVDKDFAEKWGMDPAGRLYKGGPGSTMDTAGSYEKKTRRTEGNQDLVAFLAGLALTGAALENFVFDNVDVPEVVNYMATMAVTQDIDGTDKNHYLHYDTFGRRQWRLLPWDLDLTFGPDALNTDTIVFQLQNTSSPACASHPFIGARPYLLHSGKYQRLIEAMVNTPRTRAMILRRTRTLTEQFLGTAYFQDRLEQLFTLLNADVTADRARWGGNAHFGGVTYTLRAALDRIRNEYLIPRPGYLLGTNIVGVGLGNPARQPLNAIVQILGVEANPASSNQAQEYLCLTNAAPFPMEISGWRLDGAVQFTFDPGTVMPSNGVLYVSPDLVAFRARTTGPRGGQGLFVQGNYSGQLSARGETVRLLDQFGRAAHTLTYPGTPSLAQQFLRVTELMYHPTPSAPGADDGEAFEYVELRNTSPGVTLDLGGVRFVTGIEFNFTGGGITSLAPGARVLVVKNLAAFSARHGGGLPVAGEFTGQLENGGERLQLLDARGEEILDFTYNNSWHPLTGGFGFSLVVVNESAAPDAWSGQSNWRASGALGGSPSVADPAPPVLPPVVINEALTRSDAPPPADTIELHNPTGGDADISGWFLSDDFNTPKKFRILAGTVMGADGFRSFTEADFNATPGVPPSFALSSDGDEVWLFSADAAGNLTGYHHGFHFGAAEDGASFGRHLTSAGGEHFVTQTAFTPTAANPGPRVGPVVVSEIMFRPADLPDGLDNGVDEFIELRNISGDSVELFDPMNPAHTWKLTEAVDFTFPAGLTLEAGATVLLVNFPPVNEAAALTAFRAKYAVAPAVPVLGPYGGKLDNSGESIELKKPTTPLPGRVPYVLVDKVSYRDSAPWPAGADGTGLSLQRKIASAYGNDPAHWTAAPPSAGAATLPGGAAPTITAHPQSQTVVAFMPATLSVTASGSGWLRYQWSFNGAALAGATNSALFLPSVQPTQIGGYQALVFNDAGSAVSSNATLNVTLPPSILAQPQPVQVRVRPDPLAAPTTNASFAVLAYSPASISYQWRFHGANLPGATHATLMITNVQISNGGDYTVAVTDSAGTVLSAPAALSPLVTPGILQAPVSQTVVVGGTVTLGVSVSGSPQPFGYEWRRSSLQVASNATALPVNFHTFTAPTIVTTVQYRVVVRNLANANPGVASGFAAITTLADADGDGMPDGWETAAGLNPNSAADRTGDADGDGALNWQEYIAGTDAANAQSYLKIDSLSMGGGATLAFAALSNHTYTVQYTDAPGSAPWLKLADLVARSNSFPALVNDPVFSTNRTYRLVTPQQP